MFNTVPSIVATQDTYKTPNKAESVLQCGVKFGATVGKSDTRQTTRQRTEDVETSWLAQSPLVVGHMSLPQHWLPF